MTTEAIYLDYAATTPVRPEVLEEMLPFLGPEGFGNPSSTHRFGRAARSALDQARNRVAAALGAEPDQVVFTSGGTEADNLAVVGSAVAAGERGDRMHAVVSAVEHKAVLAAAHEVVRLGGEETILPVTRHGVVQMDALQEALRQSPAIVSIIWVNNETGVIQPLPRIAERCREAGVRCHTDAVQAFGKIETNFASLGCDLMTVSGHKIGAPKGIGALLVRDRAAVAPMIHGGGQQHGVRPGTENVAGIVGLGMAAQLAAQDRAAEVQRLSALRERLLSALKSALPDIAVVGGESAADQAAHVANVLFPGCDSEALLMHFDLAGLAVSAGSACTTGSLEPSHVLSAMGVPRDSALGAVRFSLGHQTTEADVDRATQLVPGCVAKVRRLAGVLNHG